MKLEKRNGNDRVEMEEALGQFAVALTTAMEEKGWSLRNLSEELDTTYEHLRKLCRGMAFPSKYLLWEGKKNICEILGLDREQMRRLVIADKIQSKYGGIPFELSGKNPRFTKIERLLPNLTDDQFESMLGMLEGWDKRNRHNKEQ